MAHNDPCFVQIGHKKKQFLRGFTNFFFRTTGLKYNLLILLEFPNIFHSKSVKKSKVDVVCGAKFVKKQRKTGIPEGFFIFCMRYTFTSTK